MTVVDQIQRALHSYRASRIIEPAVIAVSESYMKRLREELKSIWIVTPQTPFPPLENFLRGEVEFLGVRLVHSERVIAIT